MDESVNALAPDVVVADEDGWQARKSAQMRVAILEAAIDCLGRYGYARLTTQMIAERAGVSRGAMLHHYATKLDLVAGVIDYVFYVRMKRFGEEVSGLSERQRVDELHGLELLWRSLHDAVYAAQMELAVAARTDPDVQALYEPKAIHFNRLWREKIADLFPEWGDDPARALLAIDMAQATLEGLHLNRAIFTEQDRRRAVRAVLTQTIAMIGAGAIKVRS